MKTSRFTSFIAAAAVSVGALTALVAPAAIAQAQPRRLLCAGTSERRMNLEQRSPGEGTTMMCQKDGHWKYIGANH